MAKVLKVEGKKGVSWRIDYLDPNGKRVRKMFKKKKDAEMELAARITAIDDGSYREKGHKCTTTLELMIHKYKERFGNQKSCSKKLTFLNQFAGFVGKNALLSNIKYADIDRYVNHLRETLTYKGTPHTKRAINVHQKMKFQVSDRHVNVVDVQRQKRARNHRIFFAFGAVEVSTDEELAALAC